MIASDKRLKSYALRLLSFSPTLFNLIKRKLREDKIEHENSFVLDLYGYDLYMKIRALVDNKNENCN